LDAIISFMLLARGQRRSAQIEHRSWNVEEACGRNIEHVQNI
jgi:hypothetical protein